MKKIALSLLGLILIPTLVFAKNTGTPRSAEHVFNDVWNPATNTITFTVGDDSLDKAVSLKAYDDTTAVVTADSTILWTVPPLISGYDLVAVGGHVYTPSSSGPVNAQIYNRTSSQDMLSTAITIDVGEKDSETAATPAVIDTTEDDVITADEIRIDVDGAGSNTLGLEIRLQFNKP